MIQFDTVMYFVVDIGSAAEWYSKVFESKVEWENEQYAFIRVGKHRIGFHPEDEKSRSGTGGPIVYWQVDSLSIAMKQLEELGATVQRGTLKTDLGEWTCVLVDPFKNVLGLMSYRT